MTEMVTTTVNGKYTLVLPKHRADRVEWHQEAGWEKKRIESMMENMQIGGTCFYIGAEENDITAILAMHGVTLVLFEPNPLVWANGKAIWEANGLTPPAATFVGFASNYTDTKGEPVYLNAFPPCADGEVIGNHGFKELKHEGATIPQMRLDDFVEETGMIPDYLTFDVEGSEFEVLRGAEQTILKHKPLIWASIHPEFMFGQYGEYSGDLRWWIKDHGYTETILDYQHELHTFYQ